jgi:hypothetical protein
MHHEHTYIINFFRHIFELLTYPTSLLVCYHCCPASDLLLLLPPISRPTCQPSCMHVCIARGRRWGSRRGNFFRGEGQKLRDLRKILWLKSGGYPFLSQGLRRNCVKRNKTVSSDPFWTCKTEKSKKNCSDNPFGPIFCTFYLLFTF